MKWTEQWITSACFGMDNFHFFPFQKIVWLHLYFFLKKKFKISMKFKMRQKVIIKIFTPKSLTEFKTISIYIYMQTTSISKYCCILSLNTNITIFLSPNLIIFMLETHLNENAIRYDSFSFLELSLNPLSGEIRISMRGLKYEKIDTQIIRRGSDIYCIYIKKIVLIMYK